MKKGLLAQFISEDGKLFLTIIIPLECKSNLPIRGRITNLPPDEEYNLEDKTFWKIFKR